MTTPPDRTSGASGASAPARRAGPPNGGSLPSAMNWMGGLSLLLFWLPVAGPFAAGVVGGRIAGTVSRAVAAVFLPAILTGLLVAAGVTYLADAFWGVLAGIGGVAISLIHIGPLFVGAVVGGLIAQATGRARWRRGR